MYIKSDENGETCRVTKRQVNKSHKKGRHKVKSIKDNGPEVHVISKKI